MNFSRRSTFQSKSPPLAAFLRQLAWHLFALRKAGDGRVGAADEEEEYEADEAEEVHGHHQLRHALQRSSSEKSSSTSSEFVEWFFE